MDVQIAQPRDYRWKPPGSPRIDWRKAPRGLGLCAPLNDNRALDIVGARVPAVTYGGNGKFIGSMAGFGFQNQWITINYANYTFNAPCSLEFVFIYKGTTNITDVIAAGTGFTLGYDASGFLWAQWWYGSWFSAKSKTALVVGQLYHVVVTVTNTTLSLYVNGALANSQTGGASAQSQTGFSLGNNRNAGNDWCLFCACANVAWTAAEVLARSQQTYDFLIFPEDDIFATLVGAGAAPTSHIVYRRTLSSLGTRAGSRQAA